MKNYIDVGDSKQNLLTERSVDERGVILILFALILLPLMLMMTLALDSTMLAETHEQGAYFSRISTLRALESYFSDSVSTEQVRRDNALAAAQDILAQNHILTASSSGTIVGAGTGGALLEPGIWHYVAPPTGPCMTKAGCFEPTPDASDPLKKPNAYRLKGSLKDTSPTVLAQNLTGTPPLKVNVVASVIPRHGCFLVDMSPSTSLETHISRDTASQTATPALGHGSKFAFFTVGDNPWTSYRGGAFGHDTQWDYLQTRPNRATGGLPTNPLVHWKDDYVLKAILNDSDFDLNPTQLATFLPNHPDPRLPANAIYQMDPAFRYYYRVDQFRNASHQGPQPLRSIFNGLRNAVQEFQNRRVAGDMACLIFYDSKVSWARTVKPTSDFNYLMNFTDYDNAVTLLNDNPATIAANGIDVTGVSSFEKATRHGLFPLVGSFTDLPLAMEESLRLLAEARALNPGVPTSDFLVLLGDGFTNCSGGACSDTYAKYLGAHDEIKNAIIPQLITQNIAAHVVLIGDLAGPHTIDIKRSPTDDTCMTDEEARTKNITFVAGGDANMVDYTYKYGGTVCSGLSTACYHYSTKSVSEPFYDVNEDMYNIAKSTRGLWIPVRNVPAGCVVPTTPRTCGNQAVRLRTDPLCRSDQDQVTDGMKGILGQNPYVIVSVDG